ncbi:helix-turn-helix domain-containing protein [Enterococcus casseliflavus]|nr:helix-turn-helix domain-containing protein [Enterococcus casseliflavus]
MVIHRSYFAIIPASVRYDNRLIPSAKLLYGEITALSNERGYCWASNDYFAQLYGVSKPTIQNWLKSLEDYGHIYREVKYRPNTKEVEARKIRIINTPHQENLVGSPKNLDEGDQENLVTPHQEIYQDNNTSINNTFNNTNKEEVET